MSRGVLVIEADERSGALITARQAGVDQGRTVFALPGRVDNGLSIGPHQLIRDGAILVTKLEDILEDLGPLPVEAMQEMKVPDQTEIHPQATKNVAPVYELNQIQQKIVDHLGAEPVSVDALAEASGLEIAAIMSQLTVLTLRGVIKRGTGQTYSRSLKS